ncbi:hypothetical protein TYRP_014541 [Tyrophagus putrescentiae]|nr:hypothetical protein TYRP_014541 [Tyrophagus putrescentiae]
MLQPPATAALAAGAGLGLPGPGGGSRPNGAAQTPQNAVILQAAALASAERGPPHPPPRQNGSSLTVAKIPKLPENGGNASSPQIPNAPVTTPVPGRKPSATQQGANVIANPNAHLPPPYNLPPVAQQQLEKKPRMVRKIVKAPEKAERHCELSVYFVHSDWFPEYQNARRLGPRSLRSRDPRRRTFLVSQVKPDLAALCRALINLFDNLTGGSPWLHLGDCQRPSPRTLLATLARPSATGVGSRPTAHPDVTWAMCNARRLGPCSLRSQGPRRRALHIAQVTSDLAALDCALPPHYSALPAPQGESGGSDSSENGENGENGSDKRALTG